MIEICQKKQDFKIHFHLHENVQLSAVHIIPDQYYIVLICLFNLSIDEDINYRCLYLNELFNMELLLAIFSVNI